MVSAAEQIAEVRRQAGEISPDGICWDCTAGDHKGHKEYNDGHCYGCSCPDRSDVRKE